MAHVEYIKDKKTYDASNLLYREMIHNIEKIWVADYILIKPDVYCEPLLGIALGMLGYSYKIIKTLNDNTSNSNYIGYLLYYYDGNVEVIRKTIRSKYAYMNRSNNNNIINDFNGIKDILTTFIAAHSENQLYEVYFVGHFINPYSYDYPAPSSTGDTLISGGSTVYYRKYNKYLKKIKNLQAN
jgi:hypothetical protein